MSSSEVEVFRGDLANPEAVAGAVAGRDVVLHLGALIPIPYSYRHPREFVTANVERHAERARGRAPRASRAAHRPHLDERGLRDRADRPDRRGPPAAPAVAVRGDARSAPTSSRSAIQRSFGTPVVVARPFNTYGPRQCARAVIPTIITQALSRDDDRARRDRCRRATSSSSRTRSRGMMRCAEADGVEGEVINLGTGVEISIGEVAQRVLPARQRSAVVASTRSGCAPPTARSSGSSRGSTRREGLLGWEPEVDLDEGLRRTIDWMTGSLDAYKTVDLQRLKQRLDDGVDLLVGHAPVERQRQDAASNRVGARKRPADPRR